MTFPIIKTIDDLKPFVEHLPEVRFSTNEHGFTISSVMVNTPTTYIGDHAPLTRECRGIVFDEHGDLVSRPLHKFFNVGERSDTQEGIIKWDSTARLLEKRDGSMVHPVMVNKKVILKTKKSFTSDVALIANKVVSDEVLNFCHDCCVFNLTPIFEFTSPYNRIVIKYSQPELVLLHVRENYSGKYLPQEDLEYFSKQYKIPLVESFELQPFENIKKTLNTIENFEGYVFQFENGEMVKAKSDWYLKRHHLFTALTERNVAEAVIDETLDDIKSLISSTGEHDLLVKVQDIESKVTGQIMKIMLDVQVLYDENKHLERKDFAVKLSKHNLFGLAMSKFLGKEPSYADFYAKNYLKQQWDCITI